MSQTTTEKTEFFRKMEKLLLAPNGSIQASQPLNDLKGWDSLAILEFMMLATSDYDTEVQPTAVTAAKTIDDLADLVLAGSSPQV